MRLAAIIARQPRDRQHVPLAARARRARSTRRSVAGSIRTAADATASRSVSGFAGDIDHARATARVRVCEPRLVALTSRRWH